MTLGDLRFGDTIFASKVIFPAEVQDGRLFAFGDEHFKIWVGILEGQFRVQVGKAYHAVESQANNAAFLVTDAFPRDGLAHTVLIDLDVSLNLRIRLWFDSAYVGAGVRSSESQRHDDPWAGARPGGAYGNVTGGVSIRDQNTSTWAWPGEVLSDLVMYKSPGLVGECFPGCVNVDECAYGWDDCGAGASCSDNVGSFTCVCNEGYTRLATNNISCADIDECADGVHQCQASASCVNTEGSFYCICNAGRTSESWFEGSCNMRDGTYPDPSLDDVSLRTAESSSFEVSTSIISGSAIFVCRVTFPTTVENGRLFAIGGDSWKLWVGITDGVFRIQVGRAYHAIAEGGVADNAAYMVTDAFPIDGMAHTVLIDFDAKNYGKIRLWIDNVYLGEGVLSREQDTVSGGNWAQSNRPGIYGTVSGGPSLTNVNGSTAPWPGKVLSDLVIYSRTWRVDGCDDSQLLCTVDVDECAAALHNCAPVDASCSNNNGSFTCACNAGWYGSGITCADIDECSGGTHHCDAQSTCNNTLGSYTCECLTGWQRGSWFDGSCFLEDGSFPDLSANNATLQIPPTSHFVIEEAHRQKNVIFACKVVFPTEPEDAMLFELGGDIGDGGIWAGILHGKFHVQAGDEHAVVDSSTWGDTVWVRSESFPTDGRPHTVLIDIEWRSGGWMRVWIDTTLIGEGSLAFAQRAWAKTDPGAYGMSTSSDVVIDAVFNGWAGTVVSDLYIYTNVTKHVGGCLQSQCENVDECAAELDNCAPEASCQDNDGSFSCACNAGWDGDGRSCQDIDECYGGTHECGDAQTCSNTLGSYTCECPTGFQTESDTECNNVDECGAALHNCAPDASCLDNSGSFTCSCNAGFQNVDDGVSCADRNECSEGTHQCSSGEVCINLYGNYSCKCFPIMDSWFEGNCFFQDGTYPLLDLSDVAFRTSIGSNFDVSKEIRENTAIFVSKAVFPNSTHDAMLFEIGGNSKGLWVGILRGTFHIQAGRSNTPVVDGSTHDEASYLITDEFPRDGQPHTVVIELNMTERGALRLWIDAEYVGEGVPWTTTSMSTWAGGNNGAYGADSSTDLPQGVVGTAWKGGIVSDLVIYSAPKRVGGCHHGCAAVDECASGLHYCDSIATCVDTLSGYECECPEGWMLGGLHTCVDIVECGVTDDCDTNAACTDAEGSFTCACNAGFLGDGKWCSDVDECLDSPCAGDFCRNTFGSFSCDCVDGFELFENRTCVDVDECAAGAHNCTGGHSSCVNLNGSFHCDCDDGWLDPKSWFDGNCYFDDGSFIDLTSPNFGATLRIGATSSFLAPESELARASNVIFAFKAVFPSTVQDGMLLEIGGGGQGLWAGVLNGLFHIQAGEALAVQDGNQYAETAYMITDSFPKDGKEHTVIIDLEFEHYDNAGGRIGMWIDSAYVGEGVPWSSAGTTRWAGYNAGAYALGSTSIVVGETIVQGWPDLVGSDLFIYSNAKLVGGCVEDGDCVNVDECAYAWDSCGSGTACVDTDGSFLCAAASLESEAVSAPGDVGTEEPTATSARLIIIAGIGSVLGAVLILGAVRWHLKRRQQQQIFMSNKEFSGWADVCIPVTKDDAPHMTINLGTSAANSVSTSLANATPATPQPGARSQLSSSSGMAATQQPSSLGQHNFVHLSLGSTFSPRSGGSMGSFKKILTQMRRKSSRAPISYDHLSEENLLEHDAALVHEEVESEKTPPV